MAVANHVLSTEPTNAPLLPCGDGDAYTRRLILVIVRDIVVRVSVESVVRASSRDQRLKLPHDPTVKRVETNFHSP